MSAGKIVLLVFGIIIVLISFGLITGGTALLWVDANRIDNDGFLRSDTIHFERDSHAVVTGALEIDEAALEVLEWLGIITVFRIEGMNNNPAKSIFMGVADEADLDTYLENVNHDEIAYVDVGWHLDFDEVRYVNRPGTLIPSAPVSENIWDTFAEGTGTQTLEWETEAGRYSLVMMNGDGSRGIDLDIVFKALIPAITGYGIGFLVAGIVLLIIGGLMIFFALRRKQTVQTVETPEPSGDTTEQ